MYFSRSDSSHGAQDLVSLGGPDFRVGVRTRGFVGHGFSRAVKRWNVNEALAAGALDCGLSRTLLQTLKLLWLRPCRAVLPILNFVVGRAEYDDTE
jgi:hypothetical protein